MIKALFFTFIVAFFLAFPAPTLATTTPAYAPDSLLVKFKSGVTTDRQNTLLQGAGAKSVRQLAKSTNFKLYKAATDDVQTAINYLNSQADIEYAEPDYYQTYNFVPNDTKYSSQYHLPSIKADKAWDLTKGSSTIYVADVDSGILEDHPDLAGKIYKTYNLSQGGTMSDQRCPHGTAVAGTFGAATNNLLGVASVGFNTKIIAIKINSNAVCAVATSDAIEGIQQAADSEAQVINLSLSNPYAIQGEKDVIDSAVSRGKILVASAGNNSNNQKSYPAAYDNVISVAAIDQNDNIASFSNFGPWVDLAAPGVDILTLDNSDGNAVYAEVSGTSFSSPIVAGVIALMKAKNPNLTPIQAANILCNTADKISGTGTKWQCGKLNAYAAVSLAGGSGPIPTANPTPTANPYPTPTNVPIPTPTPAVYPNPTPKPTGNPATDLLIKLRFQGIDTTAKYQWIGLSLLQGSTVVKAWHAPTNNLANGVYDFWVDASMGLGQSVISGTYDLLVKGESHLQKRFKSVSVTGSAQTVDLSTTQDNLMRAGDTTGDNKITIEDLSNISRFYKSFSTPVDFSNKNMHMADISKDGFITIQDFALAAINWSDLTVNGDQ